MIVYFGQYPVFVSTVILSNHSDTLFTLKLQSTAHYNFFFYCELLVQHTVHTYIHTNFLRV